MIPAYDPPRNLERTHNILRFEERGVATHRMIFFKDKKIADTLSKDRVTVHYLFSFLLWFPLPQLVTARNLIVFYFDSVLRFSLSLSFSFFSPFFFFF